MATLPTIVGDGNGDTIIYLLNDLHDSSLETAGLVSLPFLLLGLLVLHLACLGANLAVHKIRYIPSLLRDLALDTL